MVESIFGGKATYPLGCYERNVYYPRLAERRLSVQSTHLETISETGDGNDSFDGASTVQEFHHDAYEGPSSYRRPRTMSLPTIYRDGSYLRIKRGTKTLLSCQKRRYSEPAGIATQQIIHRLSLRSNDSSCASDESENGSCKRSSVKSMETASTARESSFQDLSTLRRHSDPMCYVTEHVRKLGITQEHRGRSRKKVDPEVTVLSYGNKPQPPANDGHSGPRVSRRRKSSLVPVPFSSPRQDTQKASHYQPFSRPLSFPPSKTESKRHHSLPVLNLKTNFLTGHDGSSESECNAMDCDYNNNKQSPGKEQISQSDESEDLEDKYTANEDILVQWMKFFG